MPGKRNPQYDLSARAARIDADALPLAVAAGAEIFEDYGARFNRGIGLIVAGLRLLLTEPAGAPNSGG